MKQILLITIAALFSCYGFSQNRAINWAFGDSAGLNFTTEPPTPFLTSIIVYEPSATISDEEGNLLFYTNGRTIWNAAHEVMLNGNFLESGAGSLSTYTQGVIIIPFPDEANKYYVFHQDFGYLKYTVVDMSFEDGLGLVTSKNNIIIEIPSMTEKMQAVRHGNGRDWWLVIEALPGGGIFDLPFTFYEFLITPEGINDPQINEGIVYTDQDAKVYLGQMKFNQQGNILACTNGRSVIIYDFDRCSGYLSHSYTIDSIFVGNNDDEVYGLEFSPNGNLIYITKVGTVGKGILYQYCLTCPEEINGTKEIIYQSHETGDDKKNLGQLQLAMDGKIYLPSIGLTSATSLSVINSPNEIGYICNFDTFSVNIGDKKVKLGLPNMPNYNLGVMEKSGCDTIGTTAVNNINKNAIQLYPNPAHNYIYLKHAPQGIVQIHIADIYGKEVLYFNQQSTDVINISTLPSGLYFIIITQENAMLITQKLVVER